MERAWWVLPQMNQTIVRTRERANTFRMMCQNNFEPDSKEMEVSKKLCDAADELFVLINKRIIEEEDKAYGKR